jgi:cytoplasmic iron level regulating protein YaaA (DUF328/UPF0246 family)
MLIIISPSKTQDFEPSNFTQHTLPRQFNNALVLIQALKKIPKKELSKLMTLSEKLTDLNYDRFQNFENQCNLKNAKQAILAFKGDVYRGIEIDEYSVLDFEFCQNTLRILSGLYGVLRPLDLIQPYRLEMSTKLKNNIGDNLYQFWGSQISNLLNQDEQEVIINLASNEYFKGIDKKTIKAKIIEIVFKENRDGKLKTIGIFAKKARGKMTNFVIKNKITQPEKLKEFIEDGYQFNTGLSNDKQWFFVR